MYTVTQALGGKLDETIWKVSVLIGAVVLMTMIALVQAETVWAGWPWKGMLVVISVHFLFAVHNESTFLKKLPVAGWIWHMCHQSCITSVVVALGVLPTSWLYIGTPSCSLGKVAFVRGVIGRYHSH